MPWRLKTVNTSRAARTQPGRAEMRRSEARLSAIDLSLFEALAQDRNVQSAFNLLTGLSGTISNDLNHLDDILALVALARDPAAARPVVVHAIQRAEGHVHIESFESNSK